MRFCRHPPHQDLYYMPIRPADRIVAAWTAMEPCDSENGCLYVAPGSHRANRLYEHSYPLNSDGTINKFYHGIKVRYLLLFILLYINFTVLLNDDFSLSLFLLRRSCLQSKNGLISRCKPATQCSSIRCSFTDLASINPRGRDGPFPVTIRQRIVMCSMYVNKQRDSVIPKNFNK